VVTANHYLFYRIVTCTTSLHTPLPHYSNIALSSYLAIIAKKGIYQCTGG